MSDESTKEIDELDAVLEFTATRPALPVVEILIEAMPEHGHLFSEKAKEALKNISRTLNPEYNESLGADQYIRKRSSTVYLAYRVNLVENQTKACQQLATTINDLADKGYIYGFLCTLSKVRLYSETLANPVAIFIYPHLTEEGAEYIKTNKPESISEEGCLGPSID